VIIKEIGHGDEDKLGYYCQMNLKIKEPPDGIDAVRGFSVSGVEVVPADGGAKLTRYACLLEILM
jgi:hypothetical protein